MSTLPHAVPDERHVQIEDNIIYHIAARIPQLRDRGLEGRTYIGAARDRGRARCGSCQLCSQLATFALGGALAPSDPSAYQVQHIQLHGRRGFGFGWRRVVVMRFEICAKGRDKLSVGLGFGGCDGRTNEDVTGEGSAPCSIVGIAKSLRG